VPKAPFIDTTQADVRPRVLDLNGVDHRPEGAVGPWDTAGFDRASKGEAGYTTNVDAGRRLLLFSLPAVHEHQVKGVIQVIEPLTATERALAQLNRTLLILVPLALLAAGIGGAFLSGRALKPVREVALAADAIQAENLAARLPVRGADEFAQLTGVLNRMLERLEAAFERQRRFTGDASHELRTPLSVIKATSSLATTDEWDAETSRRAMHSIESAADRAERIVEDLLLLARADADTLLREPQPVNLERVLSAAVEEARLIAFKGTPILLEASEIAGLRVPGDVDQLSRVFTNLLTNALRHTPAEGRILVTAERQAGGLVVQVADNGEGIAAEHLAHLGERFYRVDTARGRRRGGAGLGLAICRAIVGAHHGTMTIDSSEGVGTVVSVTLPLNV
jgi:signal transduction histidine kinase